MKSLAFAFLFLFAAVYPTGYAGAQNKADRKTAKQLQADISFFAADDLEGRRTGTDGERKAADYIEQRYKEKGIAPYKSQYRYPFHFVYGKEVSGATLISINNIRVQPNEEGFPLPFSASKHVYSEVLPEVMEQGNIWIIPLFTDQDQAKDQNFNAEKFMFERGRDAEKQGASGVLFYDGFGGGQEIAFNGQSSYETLGVPVVFLNFKAYRKHFKEIDVKGGIPIDMNVAILKADRTGNNIAAYIDNEAPYTVIVGAHYDHLGFGEDGNSLYANAAKEHKAHPGADDNASGSAALLEVAKWIKSKKLRHFNYLFINFSGEELGLYGSKAFIKDQGIDSAHTAYMINMDMVGRLNDSTHALTLGGVGTSPVWADVVRMGGGNFKVIIDSSGTGPSDHTSFYNAGIPVLFFFTGTHKDYHKPSDKAELINYAGEVQVIKYVESVVAKMDKKNIKPAFTATKQKSAGGRGSYKVTLGIMPDYTYQDGGVRVDGVSDNRPAMKAGVMQGDIITKLGGYKISGMQSYMEALGKFNPGDKTHVTVTRKGKELVLPVEMAGKQ